MSGHEYDTAELEDASAWEDEPFTVQQPTNKSRAVVSVAFSRDDYRRVATHARNNGMRTSEFIRKAVLEAMAGRTAGRVAVGVSVSSGGFRVSDYTGAAHQSQASFDQGQESVRALTS